MILVLQRLPETYPLCQFEIGQCGGFDNRFPFSWFVKNGIDQLMKVSAAAPFSKGTSIRFSRFQSNL